MIRSIFLLSVLLSGSSALAQPVSIAAKPSPTFERKWGVRLLLTSVELSTGLTDAVAGTGYGFGIDYDFGSGIDFSLELDKVEYEGSARVDRRARLRERFTILRGRGFKAYAMLNAGLTHASLPNGTGLRLDAETGIGAEKKLFGSLRLFGELGVGMGTWLKAPPSVLAVEPASTDEGFIEGRVGLRMNF